MARPMSKAKVAARKLRDRLDADYIINRTTVFNSRIGEQPYDERTVISIKSMFKTWFNSWVKEDLDTVINKVLQK